MRDNVSDLQQLFLGQVPLMDVRAPVEFKRGAFPGAINLPLMNDEERQQVGTCYKSAGQDAAIALGHRLVNGELKARRIAAWLDFARAHPDGVLYCFRGGLRSQIVQQWMAEAGLPYARVVGGYKAMRGLLLNTTQDWIQQGRFIVVGGMTGTGKTEVIRQLPQGLDLEGHAHHRGSSFGRRCTPQPAQIDFENALAIEILRKQQTGLQGLVLEDESRFIGSCSLPEGLEVAMQQAPLVWIEDHFEARVERILHDYVTQQRDEFSAAFGPEAGYARYADNLIDGLFRLRKRLGGERYARLAAIMQAALDHQRAHDRVDLHRDWIAPMLREYYDPMYTYQHPAKAGRIVFAGPRDEVLAWLRETARNDATARELNTPTLS